MIEQLNGKMICHELSRWAMLAGVTLYFDRLSGVSDHYRAKKAFKALMRGSVG